MKLFSWSSSDKAQKCCFNNFNSWFITTSPPLEDEGLTIVSIFLFTPSTVRCRGFSRESLWTKASAKRPKCKMQMQTWLEIVTTGSCGFTFPYVDESSAAVSLAGNHNPLHTLTWVSAHTHVTEHYMTCIVQILIWYLYMWHLCCAGTSNANIFLGISAFSLTVTSLVSLFFVPTNFEMWPWLVVSGLEAILPNQHTTTDFCRNADMMCCCICQHSAFYHPKQITIAFVH